MCIGNIPHTVQYEWYFEARYESYFQYIQYPSQYLKHALLMITVTSMLCFRIPGSPQAASTRTGDSSVYRVYEAYVQGQDRLLCICQPQRLPPLTTEKTYRCRQVLENPEVVYTKNVLCVRWERTWYAILLKFIIAGSFYAFV